MPDISMCRNNNCTIKTTCYRYNAEPSWRQSYSSFSQGDNGKCDHFWKMDQQTQKKLSELNRQRKVVGINITK